MISACPAVHNSTVREHETIIQNRSAGHNRPKINSAEAVRAFSEASRETLSQVLLPATQQIDSENAGISNERVHARMRADAGKHDWRVL